METWQIVLGTLFSVLTVLLGVYVSFTARQKGPIFSNTYIWLSKQEREKADKKAEYHLVTVVFGLLCMISLCETVYIFSEVTAILFVEIGLILIDIVYAIVDTVRRNNVK